MAARPASGEGGLPSGEDGQQVPAERDAHPDRDGHPTERDGAPVEPTGERDGGRRHVSIVVLHRVVTAA
ncbi:MAG: hypothetical protein ACYDCI_00495 [Candidatus Limnocylindrales bacterium]